MQQNIELYFFKRLYVASNDKRFICKLRISIKWVNRDSIRLLHLWKSFHILKTIRWIWSGHSSFIQEKKQCILKWGGNEHILQLSDKVFCYKSLTANSMFIISTEYDGHVNLEGYNDFMSHKHITERTHISKTSFHKK
jgi:hypothetical protein